MGSRPAPSVSTREDTNFDRLNRLIKKYGTGVLRDIFDHECPPHQLERTLSSYRRRLQDLFDRGILNCDQWRLLYPGRRPPKSSTFDITLLSILLRNICSLSTCRDYWQEHWHRDNKTEVNVARLRDYRNKFDHSSSASLDDAEFEEYWAKISSTIFVLGGTKNASAIRQLKTGHLDSEVATLSQELQETRQELGHLKGVLMTNQKTTEKLLREMMKSHEASTSGSFRKLNGFKV